MNVDLLATGISPAVQPGGDAEINAVVDNNTIAMTRVDVIVPFSVSRTVLPQKYIQNASIIEGPNTKIQSTVTQLIVFYFFDQHGDRLDSLYDADRVVYEMWQGDGNPDLTDGFIEWPEATLADGIKIDQVALSDTGRLFNTHWNAETRQKWARGEKFINGCNTVFCILDHTGKKRSYFNADYFLMVHGWPVIPNSHREAHTFSQNWSPVDPIFIPFDYSEEEISKSK